MENVYVVGTGAEPPLPALLREISAAADPGSKPSARRKTTQANPAVGTRKRRGEVAESIFLAKAVSIGFGVAKPWGDSHHYDFIVDAGGRL